MGTLNPKQTARQAAPSQQADAPLLLGLDSEERQAIIRGQLTLILWRVERGLPTDEAVANLLRVAA